MAFRGTGHPAIYAPGPGAGVWSAGPDFPQGSDGQLMTVRDAPACLLPNGRVLCCAGLATGGGGRGGAARPFPDPAAPPTPPTGADPRGKATTLPHWQGVSLP